MWQDLRLLLSACAGALVLYCKLRSDGRPVIQLFAHVAPDWQSRWKPACELLFFTVIGGVVSYGLVQPVSVPQAIAAGLGWTGLVNAYSDATRKPKRSTPKRLLATSEEE